MKPYPELERATYVLDEGAFRQNLSTIASIADRAGVEIILALKAFSFWPVFDVVREYLPGATASSLHEAELVFEHMGVKPHVYCPAYLPDEFDRLLAIGHKFTFNSLSELERYRGKWEGATADVGIRVNPHFSDVKTDLYNPASPTGRLGVSVEDLPAVLPKGVKGIHVHTLCESPAATTAQLLDVLADKLADQLPQLEWLNLGGGHLMTKAGYDVELLVSALQAFRQRYPQLKLILEPGSAHAWRAGDLIAHVLDIVENGGQKTAMLDVSFTCHMPDVLEMPYMPEITGAEVVSDSNSTGKNIYALGGMSCLAGDAIGVYQFSTPLKVGQQIVLKDMFHYTMVKTTQFNGIRHPDIGIRRSTGQLIIIRRFEYKDYKSCIA